MHRFRQAGFALWFALCAGAIASELVLAESAPGKIVLVRHAEVGSTPTDALGPSLNDAGRKRAGELAAQLRDPGITVIVTSRYRRTQETAEPLATELKLTPTAMADQDHVRRVAAAVRGASGTVLVVGHSDTIPGIIAELGGPRLRNLCATTFDRMFVLAPAAGGKMQMTRMLYGETSPGAANCP